MSSSKRARTLKWSTPRWSRARDLRKVAPIVFGIGPVVRIAGVSLIVGGAICVGLKLAVPQIELGFAWKALLAIPGTFAYVGFSLLIQFLVPGEVRITEEYILRSTGQTCWRVKLPDIESSKLVVFSPDHLHLFIRSKGKLRKLPVPASVDLHLLVSLLGSTIVIDKRRHFTAARSLANRTSSSTDAGEQDVCPARVWGNINGHTQVRHR